MRKRKKRRRKLRSNSGSVYDNAFRTMEGECDDLVLPFINHMFDENYDNTAVIKRLRNEHIVEKSGDADVKRVTDSSLEILYENVAKRYHIECESKKYDGTILIRVFEYDSQIALDSAEGSLHRVHMKFPNTGILLLRESNDAPKKAVIDLEMPSGEQLSYDVQIIKMSDYSLEDIFDKSLYMLLPFYIFKFERQFGDIDNDQDKIDALFDTYEEIYHRLDEELEKANLSAYSYGAIIRLIHEVANKLTSNHTNIHKKVGAIMGGKTLDIPEVRIYHKGKDEGRAEGIEEGRAEGEAERKALEVEISKLKKELETLKQNTK